MHKKSKDLIQIVRSDFGLFCTVLQHLLELLHDVTMFIQINEMKFTVYSVLSRCYVCFHITKCLLINILTEIMYTIFSYKQRQINKQIE